MAQTQSRREEVRQAWRQIIDRPLERVPVLSALHANIQDAFNEHGVQIMSPHFMTQPAQALVVPKTRWFTPPAKSPASGA